jgi:hypothetical protein
MGVMGVVESWWNGFMGNMGRERVRLREDGGRWSVEHDGPGVSYTVTPCVDERQARAELARLMTSGQQWRRMDQLPR